MQCRVVRIHGAVFYDLELQVGEFVRRVRFQDSFLSPEPKTGELLRIELILGNVSEVQRI